MPCFVLPLVLPAAKMSYQSLGFLSFILIPLLYPTYPTSTYAYILIPIPTHIQGVEVDVCLGSVSGYGLDESSVKFGMSIIR